MLLYKLALSALHRFRKLRRSQYEEDGDTKENTITYQNILLQIKHTV